MNGISLKKLRDAIMAKRINQKTLESKTGISQSHISRIMNGTLGDIRLTTAVKIADALNLSVEECFYENGDKSDNQDSRPDAGRERPDKTED